jgi:quinol monooxygenase YgiN
VVVVAVITPKPGEEDAVRQAVLASLPQVHDEPGCELYALHEGKASS